MLTAIEKRKQVCNKYSTIIGRNIYSQTLRDYCFKKYKDGQYYSDCSSSISYAYREAGYNFGILNTVGMYESSKMTDVQVKIVNGLITNPEILRPGDMLLFAGTDKSREYSNFVGHVEMVYSISPNGSITICGHGSGTPSYKDMTTYLKQRYASKTSTKIGHKGLIKVRRYVQNDGIETSGSASRKYRIHTSESGLKITASSLNIRKAPNGSLINGNKTYSNGSIIFPTAKTFVNGDAWYKTDLGWCSAKYVEGWICEDEADNRWWYVTEGYKAKTELFDVENITYYANNDGWLVQNSWFKYNDTWMYAGKYGAILCDGWILHENKYYYLNKDGIMASDEFVIDDGKLYYINSDGTMFEGEMNLISDENGALDIKA